MSSILDAEAVKRAVEAFYARQDDWSTPEDCMEAAIEAYLAEVEDTDTVDWRPCDCENGCDGSCD